MKKSGWKESIENCNLERIQEIYNNRSKDSDFFGVCDNMTMINFKNPKSLDIFKFLYSIDKNITIFSYDSFFKNFCRVGNTELAKWCYSVINENLELKSDLTYHKNLFKIACFKGLLEVAKWIYLLSNEKLNIDYDNEFVFRISCINGHYEIAKWLLSLDIKIDIHAENEFIFRFVCKNIKEINDIHFNFIEYLINSENKPNIHANNDEAFRNLCYNCKHYYIGTV